ncbi:MAG: hypothetical protein NVSMB67_27080 [Flavisolibacter sp.]
MKRIKALLIIVFALIVMNLSLYAQAKKATENTKNDGKYLVSPSNEKTNQKKPTLNPPITHPTLVKEIPIILKMSLTSGGIMN